MRPGPPTEVLTGACGWEPVVESWLGPDLLTPEPVPVLTGRAVGSTSGQVPERLTFKVPRTTVVAGRSFDWSPGGDPVHPLARFGQELTVSITVTSAVTGAQWHTRVGRYLITDWSQDDDGSVSVTAAGLLQRVADDRLPAPLAPRAWGSLGSEFRRLLPAGMAVGFAPGLVDRACPQSMEWAEDRLGALYEIADAWPARLRTDPWGQLALHPPLPVVPEPVLTLTDGQRGTVVSAPTSDTRDKAYNRVVARATDSDDPKKPPVQAVASQATGPMRVGGPYGVVTRFWSSPLITNATQAFRSAHTMLADSLRPTRTVTVQHAPDPRVDLDDAVQVCWDGRTERGHVVGYDMPLTVADGAMRTDVGVGA